MGSESAGGGYDVRALMILVPGFFELIEGLNTE
jgi:hypothetical protein